MTPTLRNRFRLPVCLLALLAHACGGGSSPSSVAPGGEDPDPQHPEGPGEPESGATAPYPLVTNNWAEVPNFLPEPFRGLALDGDSLWAVNSYGNRVRRYRASDLELELELDTGLNPVSVDVYRPEGSPALLLVVCAGTHALFLHDPDTGALVDVVRLESEPADLALHHENGWAFVSCQGTNDVLCVDLSERAVTGRFPITVGERPGPLYLDLGAAEDPGDDRVYVAAAVTGNNTAPLREDGDDFSVVLDLEGFPGGELPDEDVHRIDPFAGTVEPVVRGVGSLLFDLERHPTTGELWILATDSLNADPERQSEPDLIGTFVRNTLQIVPGVDLAHGLVEIDDRDGIDLDDVDPAAGGQYEAERSVNQARALAFDADGHAYTASPFVPVVLELDEQGRRVRELALPAGAHAYSLLVHERTLHVLCLGSQEVVSFDLDAAQTTPARRAPLGLDPTPPHLAAGREIFLDGSRSMDSRTSCASCHPRGMSDQLGWQLSDWPRDVKDVMVSQSLLSIADTYPHHWRGERDLDDFQKAWEGLLGTPPELAPTPEEMRLFNAFVHSLQAPANPQQNPRRVIDDARSVPQEDGHVGVATRGVERYRKIITGTVRSCEDCHPFPAGGGGVTMLEGKGLTPRVLVTELAHLRQLQNKGDFTLWIDKNLDGDRGTYPSLEWIRETTNVNGFGGGHSGDFSSPQRFIRQTFPFLTDQELADIVAFVSQFDQGLSAAAHWATRVGGNDVDAAVAEVEEILLAGAEKVWNDAVLLGSRQDEGGVAQPFRALWLPGAEHFELDDGTTAAWETLAAEARVGSARFVALGLPPGGGRAFALDRDNDGLPDHAERELGSDPDARDTDGDGHLDGYEVANAGDPLDAEKGPADTTPPELLEHIFDHRTARSAKYHLAFSEEVRYRVDYAQPGGPALSVEAAGFQRLATVVLPHFSPSSEGSPPFEVEVTFEDRAGNVAGPVALQDFLPLPTLDTATFPPHMHVEDLVVVEAAPAAPDTLHVEFRVRIAGQFGAPDYPVPPPMMVFASVSVEDPETGRFHKSEDFETPLETGFSLLLPDDPVPAPYDAAPGGPWLVSPLTGSAGETTLTFDQPGLEPGQRVHVSIMGIVAPAAEEGVYLGMTIGQMQPLKLEDAQAFTLTF